MYHFTGTQTRYFSERCFQLLSYTLHSILTQIYLLHRWEPLDITEIGMGMFLIKITFWWEEKIFWMRLYMLHLICSIGYELYLCFFLYKIFVICLSKLHIHFLISWHFIPIDLFKHIMENYIQSRKVILLNRSKLGNKFHLKDLFLLSWNTCLFPTS